MPGEPANGRVLLIEHDEVSQVVAEDILSQLGYQVDVAVDGAQALDLAQTRPYEAVFVNCEIPVVDGYEVARRLREHEREQPGRPHIPIIAMNAATPPGDRDRCLAAGMDDYLVKPIHHGMISTSLSRWLGDAIDPGQIEELRAARTPTGESPLADIIASFLAQAPPALDDLGRAVDRRDTAALASLAHGLKGMASVVGAIAMTEMCSALAAQGRAGDLDTARSTMRRLRTEFDRATLELRRIAARTT